MWQERKGLRNVPNNKWKLNILETTEQQEALTEEPEKEEEQETEQIQEFLSSEEDPTGKLGSLFCKRL